jgi:carboxylesterase
MRDASTVFRAPSEPLSIRGDSRGIVLLHGFTGTPFEVRPLADALAAQGCSIEAPLLAGHGTTAADLASTSWRDWLESGALAIDRLKDGARSERVTIVGASMGGLLALRLARERPQDIAALVLIAPPLRMKPLERSGLAALTSLAAMAGIAPSATIPKTAGIDVVDPVVRREVPALGEYPLGGLQTLLELMALASGDVPHVRAPALVVHGRRDSRVPLALSEELASTLGSPIVERLWLDESAHLAAIDVERDRLAAEVVGFLSRYAWVK